MPPGCLLINVLQHVQVPGADPRQTGDECFSTGLGLSEFPLSSSTPSKELEVLAGERKLRGTLLRLHTTKPAAAAAANRWVDRALQVGFRLHFLL